MSHNMHLLEAEPAKQACAIRGLSLGSCRGLSAVRLSVQ
jgi:hypothetical protein